MKKRIRVQLDDSELESLDAFVRERRCTRSEAVREGIRVLLRPALDPLLELSGDLDGLPPDLSANFRR